MTQRTAQWLSVRSSDIVDETGAAVRLRGVGLGGWLNMENFITGYPGTERQQRDALAGAVGGARAERFLRELRDRFFTEADANYLAGLGMNLLRVPFHYRHLEDDAHPFRLRPDAFAELDRVVEVCARHGLRTVLDLHAVPGWQNQDWHSDNPTHVATFWEHPHFQDRVVWLWQQLAAHYGDNPWVAGYNPLNEPADPSGTRIGPFYERLNEAVRELDRRHILFLDGNTYSGDFSMFRAPLPNAVYTAHDYALPGFADGGPYPGYSRGRYVDRESVRESFLHRTEFMRRTGTPIWIGEFGPVYTADPAGNANRRQLLSDQLEIFDEFGAHWAIWTYKDIGVHGLVTVDAQSAWLRLIEPVTRLKERFGADAWGSTDAQITDLLDPIRAAVAENFPSFDPYPFGADWLINRLIRHILFSEAMLGEFQQLFTGLDDEALTALAGSFEFSACHPDPALTDLLAANLGAAEAGWNRDRGGQLGRRWPGESRVTDLMWAARWHGPRDIRVEQVPKPRPGQGQVLVAIDRVGLCGSDLEEYRAGPVSVPADAVPIVLGHELVGHIVECPDGEWAMGTPVVPDVIVGCGRCWWCLRHQEGLCPDLRARGQLMDGGMAEYMLADAATCVPLPAGMDLDVAAFAEPAAVAVRAIGKAADLTGAVVCVHGAGTIGQLIAQACLAGPVAAVVAVDPVPSRRRLAADCGAIACAPDEAHDVVGAASGGRGADVVFECAGIAIAPAAAVRLSRRGATVVLVGFANGQLSVPWMDVVVGERRLVGSAAHLWDVDIAAAVQMLARGVLRTEALHTATVALRDVAAAFERLDTDRDVMKLLLAPTR